jgi:uncharacterized membrane protein
MTTQSISPADGARRLLPGIRLPKILRSEINRLLVASTCFSFTLVFLRIIHTHSTIFAFMAWNLFLAYIPYALSTWLTARRSRHPLTNSLSTPPTPPVRRRQWAGGKPLDIAIALAWLLFVPNSFYILTDLYHLTDSRHPHVPEWYDLILIFSFAWNGLLLGVLSVRQMEKLLPVKGIFRGTLIVFLVMALSAFGVYTGRYLRYNSWDILSNPFQLTADILYIIVHPLRNQQAWGMILCFTILLSFIYSMLKKMSRALL